MATLTQDQISHLENLLKQAICVSQSLLTLLQSEKELLRQHKPENLDEITEQKKPLVNELNQISQHIQRYLPAESASALPQILSTCDPAISKKILGLWDDFKEITKRCFEANSINGTAIAISLQHAKQLSRLLKGKGDSSLVYDQNGQV